MTQIHSDDISNVIMLNKKAITSQENALFKAELEKFRPHQNRILQAVHKQSSLMKELTRTYSDLLQDKRVRGEQNKYEAFSRQRNSVLGKYKKVYQAYKDLQAGLSRAQQFYDEMQETVDSLKKNVDSFVENRRSEGGQLLGVIEAAKGSGPEREQARMKELMERMSISPSTAQSSSPVPNFGDPRNTGHRPPPLQQQSYTTQQPTYNPAASPPITPRYQQNGGGMQSPAPYPSIHRPQQQPQANQYNPNQYGTMSPPAHQQYFSPPPNQQYNSNNNNYQQQQQPVTTQYSQHQAQPSYGSQSMPQGWQPPPPPPGPPPNQDYSAMQASGYPAGPGGYASQDLRRSQQQQQQANGNAGDDPWAGLAGWK